MNWLDFFASIVQSITSLAWPAAVFGSVWLFRHNLSRLLPLLRVKHSDWEASFRLDRAEEEAKALPATPEAPAPTPEEKQRFDEIAELSPRAAILETRSSLEQALRLAAQSAGIKDAGRKSLAIITRELRSMGFLDHHTSALLDDLRSVGNSAAHNTEAASALTVDEARRYKKLADKAMDTVMNILRFLS